MAIIDTLIKTGTPWALLCGVLLYGCIVFWKRNTQLSDKLYELGMAQTKSDSEVHHTLISVQKDLEVIRNYKSRTHG